MKMKRRGLACGLIAAMTLLMIAGCGKSVPAGADTQGRGISDDAVVRAFDTIDFDTVTIQEEEPPLGSSVNNENLEEMATLRNMAQSIFELMNAQRTQAGLGALSWDSDLENAAAVRAVECSQSFSHTRPDGSDWYTVNAQIMHGENLAFGYDSADSVMSAWMNSPTHKENILWASFTKCAIAIYKNGNTYYFAQEFRY